MTFAWWTGDWRKWKSWGVTSGKWNDISRSVWMIPGTWPGSWE